MTPPTTDTAREPLPFPQRPTADIYLLCPIHRGVCTKNPELIRMQTPRGRLEKWVCVCGRMHTRTLRSRP